MNLLAFLIKASLNRHIFKMFSCWIFNHHYHSRTSRSPTLISTHTLTWKTSKGNSREIRAGWRSIWKWRGVFLKGASSLSKCVVNLTREQCQNILISMGMDVFGGWKFRFLRTTIEESLDTWRTRWKMNRNSLACNMTIISADNESADD